MFRVSNVAESGLQIGVSKTGLGGREKIFSWLNFHYCLGSSNSEMYLRAPV